MPPLDLQCPMNFNRKVLISSVFMTVLVSCSVHQTESESQGSKDPQAVQVMDGYSVEMVAGPDLVDYPMFGIVEETGKLFLFESTGNVYERSRDAITNPQFRINLLEDTDGDGTYDKSTIYADKIGFPQGGVFYKGSLYASSAPDLLKLTDTDGDGVADEREVLLSGWTLNVNANSLVGPFLAPDGWLYMTSAIMGFDVQTQEGVRLKGETSRVWRVRPDGSGLEWVSAGGMNNPVELTFTEAGEPIGTMTYFTDPKAGQRDALIYWTEGGVYPKPNNNITRDQLPRTGELLPVVAKYSRVSPAGIHRYRNTALGGEIRDNLFSAQFNTHRIVRHRLFRDSASFRVEDDIFLWKDDEDFHPTDVFEDADGSLLVINTGGWFIKGCPLSQVSKPELEGAVYRVRKNGARKTEDAYGNSIAWSSLAPSDLTHYLEDPRPFVRDRATQALVDRGASSVEFLAKLLRTSPSADARTRAVFVLYRIGTNEALAAVREALNDKDLQVRIASARCAGLAHDSQALGTLMELVRVDDPAVRRQAATALGQIGDERAVIPLLEAAQSNRDRFVEHAIVYALISINKPQVVIRGLAHSSPAVQNVALIALDQMPGKQLRSDQLTPFLHANDHNIKKTALWIASLHPEWAGDMSKFIRNRFRGGPLTEEETAMFGKMLASFCGERAMQMFISDEIDRAASQVKILLLTAMAGCELKEFPATWVNAIGRQLKASDPVVQASALQLISLRKINNLADELTTLSNNEGADPGLRLQAVGALIATQSTITPEQFTFLLDHLQSDKQAPLRQQAATVLSKATLSEEQLVTIGTKYLPQGDAFLTPRLVPLFKGATNSNAGKALAQTLLNSPVLDSFDEDQLTAIFSSYPPDVQPLVAELMTKLKSVRSNRLERLKAMEQRIPDGDIERGRRLFFGKAACSTCHTVGPEGGHFGPDLTSIQRDRSAHDLLEAIVYPSVTFVREYESYRVKTASGEHIGLIRQQTPEWIELHTAPESSVRLARDEIVSLEPSDVSMMPQGLDQLLNDREMSDLMAFLLGQDQDPDKDEVLLR